jgi:hypothetical protein
MQTHLDHIEGEFGNLVRHGATPPTVRLSTMA